MEADPTSDFQYEPYHVFGVNQHFSKHCSCHFLGGYVTSQVLEVYMGQAVSGKTGSMVLIGGAAQLVATQQKWNMCLRKGGDGILEVTEEVLVTKFDEKEFIATMWKKWWLFFNHEIRRRGDGGSDLSRA
jgi:hypothetical protein